MVRHIFVDTEPHIWLSLWRKSWELDHSALCLDVHVVDRLQVVNIAVVLLPCTAFDLEFVVFPSCKVVLQFDACPVIVQTERWIGVSTTEQVDVAVVINDMRNRSKARFVGLCISLAGGLATRNTTRRSLVLTHPEYHIVAHWALNMQAIAILDRHPRNAHAMVPSVRCILCTRALKRFVRGFDC